MLLDVKELKKYFPVAKTFLERLLTREERYIKAVDGVSFHMEDGEVFSLVGESGSGKTTTGKLILRLVEPTSGKVLFQGRDVTSLSKEELRPLRRHMQIIYQDPYASLNPRMRIGEAIMDPLLIHGIAEGREAKEMVLDMLERVGLTPAETFFDTYPAYLSGGQRQRVAIARAMITRPKLVVADEPVSMIDVSLRASILDLMMDLRKEFGVAYLFITHDLAVAKYISDKIAIMYLGKIVELGRARDLFKNPLHPYTKALLSAIPVPVPGRKKERIRLKGEIPSAIDVPPGCRFHTRCPLRFDPCDKEEPLLVEVEPGHFIACHLHS
ncbi:MAG: ATP-binding cassette domain-containing protein [Candidatus Korarchaeota archaeon]|nr:ATP-binding cassette domain-containing protein [Candidatus Korarchaeota archaeon]